MIWSKITIYKITLCPFPYSLCVRGSFPLSRHGLYMESTVLNLCFSSWLTTALLSPQWLHLLALPTSDP